jgi:hypothetical protein
MLTARASFPRFGMTKLPETVAPFAWPLATTCPSTKTV